MIVALLLGFTLGSFFIFFLMSSIPESQINWRETLLRQLSCNDCNKLVSPLEFTFHGGLCESCFEKRHGYSYRTSVTKANKE